MDEIGPQGEEEFMQMKNQRKVVRGRERNYVKVLKAGILVLEVLLVVQHVARGTVEKSEARKMGQGPYLQGLLVMLRELNFHQRAGGERMGANEIFQSWQ